MSDGSKKQDGLSDKQRRLLELMLEEKKRRAGEQEARAAGGSRVSIPRWQGEGSASLSYAQQRLWFIEQLQVGTAAYNIPSGVRLSGPFNAGLFRRALGRTAARHDTMRTTFGLEGGRPVQRVAAKIRAQLPLVDLSGLAHEVAEAQSQRLVDRCARTPFDLARHAPWRALMIRLEPQEHVFLTVMHHIISDTWTTGVYFREMVGHYKALADGGTAQVPELPIQYGDYAMWQRSLLEDGGLLDSQLSYWVERFADAPPLLGLPTDRPRPAVQTFRGGRVTLVLPSSLTDRLKALTAEEDGTFFMTLMASYQALLHRYTGDDDILVGTPMANRNRTELENLIGLFVNTLVLRTDFGGRPSFRELLRQVRETTLQGLSHHDVPFERVVEALSLERDTSRNPLFQVLFAFQNVPIPKLVAEGLTLERYEFRETTARLDIELDLQEMPYGFVGWLGYNSDLFEAATAERMAKNFRVLLEAIAADADVVVAELALMTPEEREQVLWGSNRTAGEFPRRATLVSLFEDAVDTDPEALAMVEAGGSWSYGRLEARANRLAALLVGLGVGRGCAVGLHLERGAEMAAAALAVMKAGGFYVPLHPSFPPERVATILATAGARVLVAHGRFWNELTGELPGTGLDLDAVVVPDRAVGGAAQDGGPRVLGGAEIDAADARRVDRGVEPGDIAYAIFTSGSTGTPKGVVERHEPVVNILDWVNRTFDVGPSDRLLWVTALSFDLSVYDLFGIFAAGGSVRTASEEEVKDPGRLLAILATEPITFWDSAPAALQQLVPMLPAKPLAKAPLRLVFLSGDWIPVSLPDQVRAVFPKARMISLGGATEATIWSNCFPIEEVPAWWPSIPYGKAVRNARYHVLDTGLEPQPINVAGDLFIAGECLSSGYMGSPALTASKFLPDPWGPDPGGRMYRTGDRARYWADGHLEFLGRLDAQVKVRGYRIELGEIAAALCAHDSVCDAAVIVREDTPGDQRLVAYVVPEEGADVAGGMLRPFLQQKLPDYMVPSRYVTLESLPVTANGKLDREALPAPEGDRPELEQVYVDPESEVEQTIADLWQGVLGVDRVGRHDNFFELGGHSMLLTQIHLDLQLKYPELTLVDLFTYPTVASLAEHLHRAVGAAAEVEVHFERARARRREGDRETDIAIVGMALRYPKAVSPEELWANLTAGLECIEFFSLEEVIEAGVDPELARHPDYVRAEGTVAEVDKFDWRFFGYGTKEEVELIDPQQRIFMECCWEAFERAGYNPYDTGSVVGVFGGVNISSYLFNALYDYDPYNVMSSFLTRIGLLVGNQNDYLCTRIAYHFDLKGPAFTVQTACSTATVATHLACQSLARGECDMALAGGVQIRVPQNMGYLYQEGGFPSPDGHCRSFDARARGNVHGNGAGVLLLKRLSDAVRDGDHVHAVIKGSALANDGSVKVGFTAPGVSGQARAAAEALAVAGVGADDIGYLEATGTATELGDPIEIEALSKAYTLTTERRGFCPIGSVKSNIGHTDAASGVAALIKTALVLEHAQIPPSLHFEEPNPRIDFDSSPFFVNTRLRDFERGDGPRRAAVHTYAVGGTNTHFVLEEPPVPVPGDPGRPWQLLVLSARSSTALGHLGERLGAQLAAQPELNLADVAYTLQVGRKPFAVRRWLLARDAAEAAEVLATLPEGRTGAAFDAADGGRTALVFPDVESLDGKVLEELREGEPVFRRALDAGLAALADAGLSLDPASLPVSPEPDARGFAAVVAAVQIALGELWASWGLEPHRVVGWGSGELPAAVAAGVLSAADALALAVARGAVLAAAESGQRLEIYAPAEVVGELLAGAPGLELEVELPAGPCRVRGTSEAVDALEARLEESGTDAFRLGPAPLPASAGAALAALRDRAEAVAARALAPRARLHFGSQDGAVEAADLTRPALWLGSLTAPARPAVALKAALPGVTAAVTAALGSEGLAEARASFEAQAGAGGKDGVVELLPALAPVREEEPLPAPARLLATLGRLWLGGASVAWRGLYDGERRLRVALPTYPFERVRIWAEPQMDRKTAMAGLARDPSLRRPLAEWFYAPSWARCESAAGTAETVREGAWLIFGEEGGVADQLGRRLARCGRRVVSVRAGEGFEILGEDTYRIAPMAEADYGALLEVLGDAPVAGAVHGWALDGWALDGSGSGPGGDAGLGALLAEDRQRAFWSQVLLARSWAAASHDGAGQRGELRSELLTTGGREVVGDEELDPTLALPLAAVLSLPREYPALRCRAIDVAFPSGGPRSEKLLGQLLGQLESELLHHPPETAVAYRGRHRWVETFQPVSLPEPEETGSGAPGLVLLVGGAGALELAAAEHLVATHPGDELVLALLGENGLPPREAWQEWRRQQHDGDATAARLDRLLALEAAGARVLAEPVDLSAPAAVAAAVARLEQAAGPVRVVIHGAPELSPELTRTLGELDGDFLAYRLRDRLAGIESVTAALEGRPAVHLLAATVAAVLGGLAVVVDCAADVYLGLLAQQRLQRGDAGRWLCVDWDAVRYGHESAETAARLPREAVQAAEVPEVLDGLLRLAARGEGGRVVVSTTDLEARRRRSLGQEGGDDEAGTAAAGERRARPEDLPEAYAEPETDTQRRVAEIWAEVLGIDRVGLHDNYFDLGGNSLMATQLVSRLRGGFRVELALQSFFDGATVADVAESIEVALWSAKVQAEEAGGAVAVGAGEELGEI